MKSLRIIAAALITAGTVFGCQAQEQAGKKTPVPPKADTKKAAEAPKGAVRKAVTPEGEVIYIFAVWDAGAVHKEPSKQCKTAQCWQTADGKTWCAKPLALCPVKGKGACKDMMQTRDNKLMCPDNNCSCSVSGKRKCWCVKQVKHCPANGAAACPAKEHVKMKDGKAGCAPKAEAKAAAQTAKTGGAPVLEDQIMEEDAFFVTAN